MSTNIGTLDRTLRIVVGLALLGAALGLFGPGYATPWAFIGLVPLATAILGWCPAYTLLGLRTCPRV